MITSSAAFADGHIKYSVSADNVSEYASMLTPGMMNMFAQYPETFRMDVYENGSNCTLDSEIAAISQSNGTMINDNEGIEVPNAGRYLSLTLHILNISFGTIVCMQEL